MANDILTPTAVTREVLRVLHSKLSFVQSIAQYDDSYAKTGARIGSDLKIRLPNEYVVRSGATLSTQDTRESSTTLSVGWQQGVDLNFTSVDLTLSLDDFSKRIIAPAASVLAAKIEDTVLNQCWRAVANSVNNTGSALTMAKILAGRKLMIDGAVPPDGEWTALLNTQDNADLVDALKSLFHDSTAIKKQYREGLMGRTAGFDFVESAYIDTLASGTAISQAANSQSLTAAISGGILSGVTSITVSGASLSWKRGDILFISGAKAVHPESKAAYAYDKTFVVTADFNAATSGSISISPTIYTAGAKQNVNGEIAANSSIHKHGLGASGTWRPSLLYHKDAFAAAFADLVMPDGVDWAKREQKDGISIRLVRQYDINNDKFPCRLDVLYGFKAIRPEMAVRVHSN